MKSPLKLSLTKDTIVSQIAAFLYATKTIPESVEILDISFDPKIQYHHIHPGVLIPIEVYIKPEELEIIYFEDDAQLHKRE